MQLCLPHNQEAETGARFSVKGGTTGGWKSKHWKLWETSSVNKISGAKPNSFHRSQLLLRLNFILLCRSLLIFTTWGSHTNLNVFCVAPQQTGFVVLVVSDWTRGASILRDLTISNFWCGQSGFFQDHLKNSKSPTPFACPLAPFSSWNSCSSNPPGWGLKKRL